MTTISDERLAEIVGAGVPCVPIEPWEVAHVVQELRSLRSKPVAGVEVKPSEIEDLIEQLLNAQQDINFAANSTMDQSLCDASALIDKVEAVLRRILSTLSLPAQEPVAISGSAAEYSRNQLAQLAFAIYYSANLCAPQNIAAVIEEIDTCGSDCEHISGSMCHREEQGKYCSFSLAEDLRQLSAALYGPTPPTGYVEDVFGPDRMHALYVAPQPEAVITQSMIDRAKIAWNAQTGDVWPTDNQWRRILTSALKEA